MSTIHEAINSIRDHSQDAKHRTVIDDQLAFIDSVVAHSDGDYNGWTNRETWATALHIDNDQGLYNYRLELCELVKESEYPEGQLANLLQGWMESLHEAFYHEPNDNAGLALMFCDIGSLWRVEYREIARNWLEE